MKFLKKLFKSNRTLISYKKGIHYYNNKNFQKAIEQFEIMLSEKSNRGDIESNLSKFYCSQAYRNIGIILFAKGKNKKALENFQQALFYNPNHTDLNYFIGICLNNVGKFQEAIESFHKLQSIDPNNIPNKLKMAVIFHNLGMWDNAEKINRSILLKKPHYADVHFHLGLSLLSQGKSKQAVESFENALDINPKYINARLKLSIAQANIGLFNEAFYNLEKILKTHPDYADVNYLYGALKGEIQEFDTAIVYLKKAVQLNPKYKTAHIKLIVFFCNRGDTRLAQAQINSVYENFPLDKQIKAAKTRFESLLARHRENISKLLAEEVEKIFGEEQLLEDLVNEFYTYLDIMPSFSEIIMLFTNSKYVQENDSISEIIIPLIEEQIEKHPDYPDLNQSLGSQLLAKHRIEEALNSFEKAVSLNPNYVAARIDLMKTLTAAKKYKQAYEQGEELISQGIDYPDVHASIAETLYKLNQYETALRHAQKALELKSSMTQMYLLTAKIYHKLGKTNQAINELDQMLAGNIDPELAVEGRKVLDLLK